MPEVEDSVGSLENRRSRATPYVPKIVVKLRDEFHLPYEDGVERYFSPQFDSKFDQNTVNLWQTIVRNFGNLTLRRLITSVTPEEIERGVEDAYRFRWNPEYLPPNFLTYFFVTCPKDVDPAAIVEALEAWPPVERAYIQSILTEPPGVIRSPTEILAHDYHGPEGINAEYAWCFIGGDGAGQQFIDIEQGWFRNHEDLPPPATIPILSSPRPEYFRDHGTAALGIVLAVPGNAPQAGIKDCVGIAPNVANAYVVSEVDVDFSDPWNHDRVNAIWTAYNKLNPGDVLLLESQIRTPSNNGHLPVEVEDFVYDAIELCTQKGIIVIEPAGNGRANGNGNLNPIALKGDSGAIMVASAYSWYVAPTQNNPGHPQYARPPGTNYGNRINCFAWDDTVYTTDYSWDLYSQAIIYYSNFSGTSAASAMIAGAALLLQGIAQANQLNDPARQYRFDPIQVRNYLSDHIRIDSTNPETGNTLSGNSQYDPADPNNPVKWNADHIGVMPNLKAVINKLGLTQDIYIRDFVGDVGLPHTGMLAASPDIILRPSSFDATDPVQDQLLAQNAYGEGSGTEDDNTLGDAAQAGQDNFIYVRVRNRGNAGAAGAAVTLFWSEPATLVTPTLWQPPGGLKTRIPSVPPTVLTVSHAITWPAGLIPAIGHYCFVALVGNALDPAPAPASFLIWNDFEQFIRQNNNVTWKNYIVVDILPMASTIWAGFNRQSFSITGPHDRARDMRLEVVAQLPPNAKIMLQVPIAQRDLIEGMGSVEDSEEGTVLVHLNPQEPSSSKYSRFPKNLRSKASLFVHIPEEFHRLSYEVGVRQLYDEREVGRITWKFKQL